MDENINQQLSVLTEIEQGIVVEKNKQALYKHHLQTCKAKNEFFHENKRLIDTKSVELEEHKTASNMLISEIVAEVDAQLANQSKELKDVSKRRKLDESTSSPINIDMNDRRTEESSASTSTDSHEMPIQDVSSIPLPSDPIENTVRQTIPSDKLCSSRKTVRTSISDES